MTFRPRGHKLLLRGVPWSIVLSEATQATQDPVTSYISYFFSGVVRSSLPMRLMSGVRERSLGENAPHFYLGSFECQAVLGNFVLDTAF